MKVRLFADKCIKSTLHYGYQLIKPITRAFEKEASYRLKVFIKNNNG